MPESNPLQAGQRFGRGRFVLIRPLGRGGMGEVWLARDVRLQEEVALKFLPWEIRGNAAALDDLRRETARCHRLTHPHIVRIHDLHEEEGGVAFIVMEYIDGPTLAALRLEQPQGVLGWDFLRPLVEKLCAALDYAHSEGVVHRDLKPTNLMADSRGRLKLADFGIAAGAGDGAGREPVKHSTGGTLFYMSPQQLNGQRPQATDDIYALGATLYELLTSEPPFHGETIIRQILREAPEPMEERLAALEIRNEIPPDGAALIMACLAKEAGQRPQSTRAVAGWVGLEVARKPSLEALSQDVFSAVEPDASEIEAPVPAEPGFSRKSWAVGVFVALLLLAAGGSFVFKHYQESLRLQTDSATAAAAREPKTISTTIFVGGKSDPWLAGMPDGSMDGDDPAPDRSPAQVTGIPIETGAVLTFSATGEEASGEPEHWGWFGPEGNTGNIVSHTAGPQNGIGNIRVPLDALVGVFLDDSIPAEFPPPPLLKFGQPSMRNFQVLQPALRQPFFIGTGLTSEGVARQFIAPEGATRLFLGAMDFVNWADNVGGFTVTVTRVP